MCLFVEGEREQLEGGGRNWRGRGSSWRGRGSSWMGEGEAGGEREKLRKFLLSFHCAVGARVVTMWRNYGTLTVCMATVKNGKELTEGF